MGALKFEGLSQRRIQIITAGNAEQRVPAQSDFLVEFINGARGAADYNKDGIVTGAELVMYLKNNVETSSVQDGIVGMDTSGEFVFVPDPKQARKIPFGVVPDELSSGRVITGADKQTPENPSNDPTQSLDVFLAPTIALEMDFGRLNMTLTAGIGNSGSTSRIIKTSALILKKLNGPSSVRRLTLTYSALDNAAATGNRRQDSQVWRPLLIPHDSNWNGDLTYKQAMSAKDLDLRNDIYARVDHEFHPTGREGVTQFQTVSDGLSSEIRSIISNNLGDLSSGHFGVLVNFITDDSAAKAVRRCFEFDITPAIMRRIAETASRFTTAYPYFMVNPQMIVPIAEVPTTECESGAWQILGKSWN